MHRRPVAAPGVNPSSDAGAAPLGSQVPGAQLVAHPCTSNRAVARPVGPGRHHPRTKKGRPITRRNDQNLFIICLHKRLDLFIICPGRKCPGLVNVYKKENNYLFSSYFTPPFEKVIILFCSFIIRSMRQPQPHSQTSVECVVVKWSTHNSFA